MSPGLAADGAGPSGPGMPDGKVDQLDYDFWKANYGQTVPGSGSGAVTGGATVPEPSGHDSVGFRWRLRLVASPAKVAPGRIVDWDEKVGWQQESRMETCCETVGIFASFLVSRKKATFKVETA